MSLVREVVEAHGGLDRWRQASAIRLRVSSGGLAFATKQFGGIAVATRRRVRPTLWSHRPLLVWIDVLSADVTPAGSCSAAWRAEELESEAVDRF